ncbi:MAG: type I-U CRISPR-associated protein Csb2 [Micrococcus sp.]|nr:type I-U CRISPR-associated protein Csb2 [Micrococcus sp.]
MAALAIAAEFPFGVYIGHGPDGEAERLPDFGRVFSALVQAAATGTQSTGDSKQPYSTAALEALDWLESHPPSGLVVPPVVAVSDSRQRGAWRKEGVFHKEGSSTMNKTTLRRMSDGTALGGEIQWVWDTAPDHTALVTLDDLCADVPHLGETASPVRLRVTRAESATHHRDDGAGFVARPGEIRQRVPRPGRRDELDAAHAALYSTKRPTLSRDNHNTSALPAAPVPPARGLTSAVYMPTDLPEAGVPWTQVLAVPVTSAAGTVPDEHVVSVCVALHRALASQLGRDASPIITGRFPPGVTPPANRVALHLLASDTPSAPFDDGRDRFLVMIPRGMGSGDFGALVSALTRITRVVTREHQLTIAPAELEVMEADRFWMDPLPSTSRSWDVTPGLVPERHIKPRADRDELEVATTWSIGNVFREVMPDLAVSGIETRRDAVLRHGVRVWGRALRTLTPRAYVHRIARGHPVQPFRAEVQWGGLVGPRTLLALGQSRHLGCGLLIPVDRPVPSQENDS